MSIPESVIDAAKFDEWIRALDEDVIQGEYGYEPGEFTVYTSHWRPSFEEGLTPHEAFKRALDGYANARLAEETERKERYARIIEEDEAASFVARREGKR